MAQGPRAQNQAGASWFSHFADIPGHTHDTREALESGLPLASGRSRCFNQSRLSLARLTSLRQGRIKIVQTGKPTAAQTTYWRAHVGIDSREAKIETNLDDIAARTIGVIASHTGMKAAEITRDTELDEIGVNSLQLTEIVMDLEDLYDVEIDLNAAEAWDALKNVGDVVDAINKLVSARN
jgi:nodulation protein F